MPVSFDFPNLNALWAFVLVQTLVKLGLQKAVICPGSRSTPLTVAFAQHPELEAIPVLDERSASFFALGLAKRSHCPVALVCTSGTAGANFYPAVIEARESRVPLLVFTADRPGELRYCHAGQTINQVGLYGDYPQWQGELILPENHPSALRYLRQTLIQAWHNALMPRRGVVHVNCPFRKPLEPLPQDEFLVALAPDFFHHIAPLFPPGGRSPVQIPGISELLAQWCQQPRGIIIAGVDHPPDPETYCQAIADVSNALGFPVLAEGLSPVRNHGHLNTQVISRYDLILRNPQAAEGLRPQVVIQIGAFPTSKTLRSWLEDGAHRQFFLSEDGDNFDPLHNRTRFLPCSVVDLAAMLPQQNPPPGDRPYPSRWLALESQSETLLHQVFDHQTTLTEAQVSWLLGHHLPAQIPFIIANSMAVRQVEFFWPVGDRRIIPYGNRGTNGIDGTLSTALGVVHGDRGVLLTGDLALLHDLNGFLIHHSGQWRGHLTIVLVNNDGGGIFEMLPIAQFPEVFDRYFRTPQGVSFAQVAQLYHLDYEAIASAAEFRQRISTIPATPGIRLLEICTQAPDDARWLREVFPALSDRLVLPVDND